MNILHELEYKVSKIKESEQAIVDLQREIGDMRQEIAQAMVDNKDRHSNFVGYVINIIDSETNRLYEHLYYKKLDEQNAKQHQEKVKKLKEAAYKDMLPIVTASGTINLSDTPSVTVTGPVYAHTFI